MSEHELWNELGNLYYLAGSYDQAIHAYNKAIQLDNRLGKPYSNLALIYSKQGKYEAAIELYKRSLALLNNSDEKATTWNRLGNVYRHLKQYQEAVYAFQCADDLREELNRIDGPPDQIMYVASESEAIPFDMIDVQRDYQNHSVDYLQSDEPEFDESVPDQVPVEIEMLVREADVAQEVHALWKVVEHGNPEGPAPIMPAERSDADVVIAPVETTEEPQDVVKMNVSLDEVDVRTDGEIDEVEQPSAKLEDSVDVELDEDTFEELDAEDVEDDELPLLEEFLKIDVEPEQPIAQAEDETEVLLESEDASITDAEMVSEQEESESVLEEDGPDTVPDEQPQDVVDDAQFAKRDIGQEEEDLAKQIEINPRSATTWEALGTLYKTAGRYEEASQAFNQAILISPKTVSYHHNLGLVYAAQGNDEDACKSFQEVLRLDPDHSLTHASLGGYYKKIGLDELAQKHIGKAMRNIYESENEYNRACLDAICGNIDRAINLLRIALENKQTYVSWVLNDPDLDSLRSDDRFRRLISEFSE